MKRLGFQNCSPGWVCLCWTFRQCWALKQHSRNFLKAPLLVPMAGFAPIHSFCLFYVNPFPFSLKTQTKKGGWQKNEFCPVSPIKLIHLKVFNSASPLILKETLLILLTLILRGKNPESRNERDAEFLPPCFFSLGSLYVCSAASPSSIALPPALPQFPLKCQMQQLSASERGAPWWEQPALLTWRPRLFSSPLFGVAHPTFSADVVWGSTGCKGMSFFSPGHVNGLAQKRWLILWLRLQLTQKEIVSKSCLFFFFSS